MEEQENIPVDLQQDPLVEKLMPNPSQYPNVQILAGFLGKSSQPGHWRLYPTSTLDNYLEIPEADIVHSQSLVSEQNPQGGTMLWVKRDAAIVLHTRTDLRQTQAQFLQGEINNTFLSRIATLKIDCSARQPVWSNGWTTLCTFIITRPTQLFCDAQ